MEFIILLVLINFSIEYVTIPFTSTLSNIKDNLSPNEFMLNMYSNDLITKIKIGTPYQELNLFLDFDSYLTYFLNPNLNNIKSTEIYNNSKSSTYIDYNKETLFFDTSSFEHGKNSSDILKLNNKINNIVLRFILVTKSNLETKLNYAGSFGLGAIDNGEINFKQNSLIYQFKKYNLTDNYMFTLIFNKNNNDGKIIFGKNIYEKYSDDLFQFSNIIFTKKPFKFIWGWDNFKIYYNNYLSNIETVIIQPDIGVCLSSTHLRNEFYNRFFDKLIQENKCFEGIINNFYFFYCNEDINLDFVYLYFTNPNNIKFKLDYNDLIKVYNGKKYLLILFNQFYSSKKIYIGLPLLKKYDFIFDQDKKIMGFYNFKIDNKDDNIDDKKKKDDNDEYIDDEDNKEIDNKKNEKKIYPGYEDKVHNKLYLVFLLLFLILIILYCIFISYRRNRRKKNKFYRKEFEYEEFDKI